MNIGLGTILAKNKLRLTTPRQTVFDILSGSSEPLYIHSIAERCPRVDRVTIYRTIELFLKLHIIETVHIGWKKQYELSQLFKPHHHHLHCKSCGQITELRSNRLEAVIEELASEADFLPSSHRFEVTGLCAKCRK